LALPAFLVGKRNLAFLWPVAGLYLYFSYLGMSLVFKWRKK
jgi:hypothetical protein